MMTNPPAPARRRRAGGNSPPRPRTRPATPGRRSRRDPYAWLQRPAARWCGAAPVAASSGEGHGNPRRYRLDLAGNREVNSVLHIVHVTQARMHDPARSYLTRRKSEGKTVREARRSHKRQLANVIIRHMWNDADRLVKAQKPVSTVAA